MYRYYPSFHYTICFTKQGRYVETKILLIVCVSKGTDNHSLALKYYLVAISLQTDIFESKGLPRTLSEINRVTS